MNDINVYATSAVRKFESSLKMNKIKSSIEYRLNFDNIILRFLNLLSFLNKQMVSTLIALVPAILGDMEG
jgi:hypothetical protein